MNAWRAWIIYGYIGVALFAFLFFRGLDTYDVSVGYFHGGRTILLYRAYVNSDFEKEGISVKLVTRSLRDSEFSVVPDAYEDIRYGPRFGRITGTELLNEVARGRFDGATPGESSFIEAVARGVSIVAVAELGHDTKERPSHAIVFREGVSIKKPGDIRGKRIASVLSGPGQPVFLREFLRDVGVTEDEVFIEDELLDDVVLDRLNRGTLDGAYLPLMGAEKAVQGGYAYVYRTLDWLNPELSHALLVFNKQFVEDHPEQVEKVVRVYMKRVAYEHSLPKGERLKDPGEGRQKGLQMEKDFQGMNLPQYDDAPTVSEELLNEMQDLMIRYGYLDKRIDLTPFIDNSFVEKIAREGFN